MNSRLSGALYEGGANGVEESFSHPLTFFCRTLCFLILPLAFFLSLVKWQHFCQVFTHPGVRCLRFCSQKMNINFSAFLIPQLSSFIIIILFFIPPLLPPRSRMRVANLFLFSLIFFYNAPRSKNICCCEKFWNS